MKIATSILAAAFLLLTGCGAETNPVKETVETLEKEIYTSSLPAEECYLCGQGAGEINCWGQDNLGIISLETFEVMPIEINRYDEAGNLTEENTGYMKCREYQRSESGFSAYILENADRGYAQGQIWIERDNGLDALDALDGLDELDGLDVKNAASFLCDDCLQKMCSDIYREGSKIGVIHFGTREIRVLEECLTGFSLGDYYIHCEWREKEEERQEINILAFYCPLRYAD